MSITYTYEILSVDEASRCMEVVYRSEGHKTMHISARLPFEGEPLEDVIRSFAPVPLWEELAKAVSVPEVGLSGTLAPLPLVFDSAVQNATPPSGEIPQTVL